MPKTSNKPLKIRRSCQLSDSHCGPAVIQMLLRFIGTNASQREVERLGKAKNIAKHGMRVDQLQSAVEKIAPQYRLWHKQKGTLREIRHLVENHGLPVGIEWQGLFETKQKTNPDEYGHYSIIIGFDKERKELLLADPYREFYRRTRRIGYRKFKRRWWDENEVSGADGRRRIVKDVKLFFIIAPRSATFPDEIGMK